MPESKRRGPEPRTKRTNPYTKFLKANYARIKRANPNECNQKILAKVAKLYSREKKAKLTKQRRKRADKANIKTVTSIKLGVRPMRQKITKQTGPVIRWKGRLIRVPRARLSGHKPFWNHIKTNYPDIKQTEARQMLNQYRAKK